MNDILKLLVSALKGGFRTSEFWLSLIALLVPLADMAVQHLTTALNDAQNQPHSALVTIILAGAAAFVSAAYAVARALVKREQVRQIPTAAALAGYAPNIATTIPGGTADSERAHALASGATTSQLGGTNVPQ